MLLLLAIKGVKAGFYIFSIWVINDYIKTLSKILIHDPRPHMVDDRINALSCSYEYGTPSGHACNSTFIFVLLFLEYNYPFGQEKQKSFAKYLISLILGVSFIFIMCYDRVYVGVHTIDQLILGIAIGLWVPLWFHCCYRNSIYKYLESIQNTGNRQFFIKVLMASLIFIVIILAPQVLAFVYTDQTFSPPQIWKERLNRNCIQPPLFNTFHYSGIYYAGSNGVILGAFIGLLIHGRSVHIKAKTYSILQVIIKYVTLIVILALCKAIDSLVPFDLPSIYLVLVLKGFIPSFLPGLLSFSIPDILLDRIILKMNKLSQVSEPLIEEKS
ncbi:pap2 superfamily phosphatase [Stylonychia lemnae]|uniref:Pap2 superfamily phosphatase n=1 Tax=Stylonychia lemnae TaxID=5949 RepID=A0A077ZZY7_STYLE|nr:pap2 superfamily phosphatase [Stylonychia lemnae]|eukprot:CDW75496.1 pap2 superfamily phosphatase [Stylonychia lemnae]